MQKILKHKKMIVLSFAIFLITGIGSFFYYSQKQKNLEKNVYTAQSSALKTMEDKQKGKKNEIKKEKETNDSSNSSTDESTVPADPVPLELDMKNVDYNGKDVVPLTEEAMKKVDAEKVVSSFGVGTIEIPSIGMNLPILEGISQNNLSVGAGTMKEGQKLKYGNFALAGHYMTNAGLLFGGIKNVKKNDQIKITYKNETANYKVTEVKQITQADSQVIYDSEGEGILTLITCDHAVEGTEGRVMVRATLD